MFVVLPYMIKTHFPQLVRCFRYKDLYDNVLFNYQVKGCSSIFNQQDSSQWLYNKMCALPLPEVICLTFR